MPIAAITFFGSPSPVTWSWLPLLQWTTCWQGIIVWWCLLERLIGYVSTGTCCGSLDCSSTHMTELGLEKNKCVSVHIRVVYHADGSNNTKKPCNVVNPNYSLAHHSISPVRLSNGIDLCHQVQQAFECIIGCGTIPWNNSPLHIDRGSISQASGIFADLRFELWTFGRLQCLWLRCVVCRVSDNVKSLAVVNS